MLNPEMGWQKESISLVPGNSNSQIPIDGIFGLVMKSARFEKMKNWVSCDAGRTKGCTS